MSPESASKVVVEPHELRGHCSAWQHAAGFGALTIGKLAALAGSITLEMAAAVTALVYISWHAFRASRVVFDGSFGATLLKFTAVALIYWAFVILATVGLVMFALVTV